MKFPELKTGDRVVEMIETPRFGSFPNAILEVYDVTPGSFFAGGYRYSRRSGHVAMGAAAGRPKWITHYYDRVEELIDAGRSVRRATIEAEKQAAYRTYVDLWKAISNEGKQHGEARQEEVR